MTILAAFAGIFLLFGCNVYSSFSGESDSADLLEAAQACLREKDVACARAAYAKIPETALRYEKLCKMDLLDAGFGLTTMVGALQQQDAKMLGGLANELVPYTAAKGAAAAEAVRTGGSCDLYLTDPLGGDEAVLLKSIAFITHCALLIARVDEVTAASNALTDACATPGRKLGRVIRSSIADGGNTGGVVVSQGMCGRDALACRDSIVGLKALQGQLSSKYQKVKSAYDLIPAALSQTGNDVVASNLIRDGIQATVGDE